MNEEYRKVFEDWKEAAQKFDYFITGFTGAITIYMIQHYKPSPLGLNSTTIELFSFFAFILSFYYGLKRLEDITTIFRMEYNILSIKENEKK